MKIFFIRAWVIVVATSMVLRPFPTSAGLNDIFKGWAWTPNIGWLSMNSTNRNAANSYGVTIDDSRNVRGWAWSTDIGWICFGATCPGTAPDGGASWALLDTLAAPQLHGWARIYSLYALAPTGNEGWISLNCASSSGHPARNVCAASSYYVYTSLADGLFRGFAYSCMTSDGSSGCSASGKYASGVGWIRFDPIYTPPPNIPRGTYGGVPWVQVLYGDLYAKGGLNTPSPFTTHFEQINAYYCMDKGVTASVQRFTQGDSGQCATGTLSFDINAPEKGTYYSNTLGRIQLRGYPRDLVPSAEQLADLAAGKYGPWMQVANLDTGIPVLLAGRVYDTVAPGDYSIGSKTFNNAVGDGNGSGLIIVRGNLTITGDLLYQDATISKLQNLASLGILVLDDGTGAKGNVTIAPGVQTISANIYAEGIFSTGTTGNPTTDQPLTVNGVLVAKQLNFQRQYPGGVGKPSEKVVYDGRIVANTPPGLNDFIASLPAISY